MRELLLEKVLGCRISADPVPPKQKIVDFIGENKFLDMNVLGPQALQQIHSLRKRHVAVVVAVNEKNRRTPGLDRRIGRGFESGLQRSLQIGSVFWKLLEETRPVVNAVQIDPGREDV